MHSYMISSFLPSFISSSDSSLEQLYIWPDEGNIKCSKYF